MMEDPPIQAFADAAAADDAAIAAIRQLRMGIVDFELAISTMPETRFAVLGSPHPVGMLVMENNELMNAIRDLAAAINDQTQTLIRRNKRAFPPT